MTAALMCTLAAVLSLTGCGGDDPADTGTSSSARVHPDRAPTQVRWSQVSGVSVPTSRVDGPTTNDVGGTASGYTHTPQGAILAMEQGQARLSMAADGAWPGVLNALTAPGPGRDAFASTRVFASITPGAQATNPPRYVAYKFTTYTPERADAQVLTIDAGGAVTATPVTAIWRGGDWKVLLPDPASNPPGPQRIQGGVDASYIPFAAPTR